MKNSPSTSANKVTQLDHAGWAMREGIQIDDEIFEVEDVPFAPLSRAEKAMILLSHRPMTIRLKRPIIKDVYIHAEL